MNLSMFSGIGTIVVLLAMGASMHQDRHEYLADADMSLMVGSCPNGNGTVTGSYCDQAGILCLNEVVGGMPDCCLHSKGREDCFTEQTPRSNGFPGDWIIGPVDCDGRFREFPCTCNNKGICVGGAFGNPLVCMPTKTGKEGC